MPFSDREEIAKLDEWLCGDVDAIALLKALADISQIADDYADGDAEGSDEMTRLLHLTLCVVPLNPFFQQNANWLVPVMSSSMHLWNASNEWDSEFGFVYRESLEQLIHVAAMLIGGQEHAASVAKDVNKFYHQDHGEEYADWLKEQEKNG
jgi:DNA-binding FadR family transcriptional regulator